LVLDKTIINMAIVQTIEAYSANLL